MNEERKRCSRCGVDHPMHFFRRSGKKITHKVMRNQYKGSVCKACESKERIEKKNTDPLIVKVRRTIEHHAKREGKSFRSFLYSNNLTVDYIKMLFEREWKLHELGYGCLNCVKPMKDILDDFSLDLIDPQRPPTRSNLRIICRTCNVEKGHKNPTDYDMECAEYRHNESTVKSGVQFNLSEIKTKEPSQLSFSL